MVDSQSHYCHALRGMGDGCGRWEHWELWPGLLDSGDGLTAMPPGRQCPIPDQTANNTVQVNDFTLVSDQIVPKYMIQNCQMFKLEMDTYE